jgi:hypothetical protein
MVPLWDQFSLENEMNNNIAKILIISAASTAFLGISGVASADEVRLTGSTEGRFNAGAYGTNDSLLGLKFSSSTFDNTTVSGQLDFGGDPTPGSNFNNLGSFTLDSVNNVYDGNHFDLRVMFSAPATIVGGTTTTFSTTLTGTVSNNLGGVFVDFDNTPKTFTFSNATTSGSFTIAVNDVSIAPGHDASITAHVTGSQQPVPEPSAFVGILCGSVGMLSLIKRKR